jgi:hypothetical protein
MDEATARQCGQLAAAIEAVADPRGKTPQQRSRARDDTLELLADAVLLLLRDRATR